MARKNARICYGGMGKWHYRKPIRRFGSIVSLCNIGVAVINFRAFLGFKDRGRGSGLYKRWVGPLDDLRDPSQEFGIGLDLERVRVSVMKC